MQFLARLDLDIDSIYYYRLTSSSSIAIVFALRVREI